MARMKQGRETAEMKKRMTERSNFAPVANLNKAKKQYQQQSKAMAESRSITVPIEKSKYKSAFGKDGAQIVPDKKKKVTNDRAGNTRTPLHIPRSQPKFKKNTMIDLLEKENEFAAGRKGLINKAKETRFSPGRRLADNQRSKHEKEQYLRDLDPANNKERIEPLDSMNNRNSRGRENDNTSYSANKKDTSPIDQKIQQAAVEEPLEDLDDSGMLVDQQLRQYMPDDQDHQQNNKSSNDIQ